MNRQVSCFSSPAFIPSASRFAFFPVDMLFAACSCSKGFLNTLYQWFCHQRDTADRSGSCSQVWLLSSLGPLLPGILHKDPACLPDLADTIYLGSHIRLGFLMFFPSCLNVFSMFLWIAPLLTFCECKFVASLVAQTVKNLPAMQKTQVQSLRGEDPLEEGIATRSSILVWRIPWTEEPGRLQFTGSEKSRT